MAGCIVKVWTAADVHAMRESRTALPMSHAQRQTRDCCIHVLLCSRMPHEGAMASRVLTPALYCRKFTAVNPGN